MASCGGIRLHLGFFFLPLLFFLEDGFLLLSDFGLHAQRETPSIALRLHLHLQFMHRAILKRTSLTGHHMERRSIPCKFFFFSFTVLRTDGQIVGEPVAFFVTALDRPLFFVERVIGEDG